VRDTLGAGLRQLFKSGRERTQLTGFDLAYIRASKGAAPNMGPIR